jgi:hypothetical protein
MKVKMDGKEYTISARYATSANGSVSSEVRSKSYMDFLPQDDISSGWIAAKENQVYIYSTANSGKWLPIKGDSFKNDYFKKLRQFKSGGLADFTGPAWLDGTKSRPELVLNARDTQNFIQLKDILSEVMKDTDNIERGNTTSNGDNYFDININVEELKDDYDVEQLADKIRSMLYEDASYRNVNTVSLTR